MSSTVNSTLPKSTAPSKSMTPMPVQVFLKKIKGTSDEVWSVLLAGMHKAEKHTEAEWHKLIADYGKQPASPNVK